MLLDPKRNVVLMDGYNGPPRKATGKLCGGDRCLRDGLTAEDVVLHCDDGNENCYVTVLGEHILHPKGDRHLYGRKEAVLLRVKIQKDNQKCRSGREMDVGCYHAEMNCILNAAAQGVSCDGAWMIVTGEPCGMCAKLIYHAGITKVICIENGYRYANGVGFLKEYKVEVEKVPHPFKKPKGSDSNVPVC